MSLKEKWQDKLKASKRNFGHVLRTILSAAVPVKWVLSAGSESNGEDSQNSLVGNKGHGMLWKFLLA